MLGYNLNLRRLAKMNSRFKVKTINGEEGYTVYNAGTRLFPEDVRKLLKLYEDLEVYITAVQGYLNGEDVENEACCLIKRMEKF